MKLSALKFAFGASLLLHGVVFSAVYVAQPGNAGPRSAAAVENVGTLEIFVVPQEMAGAEPEIEPLAAEASPQPAAIPPVAIKAAAIQSAAEGPPSSAIEAAPP